MPEPSPQHRLFRFGIFELDGRSGELRKDGKAQPRLQEQSLRVLLLLLERAGAAVTREELRQKLWSSDTFVDFDHGLNTVINKLREALGDSAASPRFIQTLPRRGYRFIAPIDILDATPARQEPPVANARQPDSSFDRPSEETPSSAAVARPALFEVMRRSVFSDPFELPVVRRGTVRVLFSAIQILYLSFYLISLAKFDRLEGLLSQSLRHASWLMVLLIITAVVGIPIRLYLFSAVIFDYRGLGTQFLKLFPFLFPLDELWALAPFLLVGQIGFGLALAATAALLYLPFSQRSLLLMGYGERKRASPEEPASRGTFRSGSGSS